MVECFTVNSAKTYIGKNVNLHLKDGGVIVNVQLKTIKNASLGKTKLLEYTIFGNNNRKEIPLRNIAYAQALNKNLILVQAK
ncbi:MAG: hypothetical protein LBH62_07255 [Nitrososphaerota archaeon]|jgi:hypothetical protein|uniref:hypothetical protein n=1 Tax=Candidatus Bathycorpusculum sp. TaxID=2994959 RepID=UPI0028290F80|nr:hypothetical protein [Candidatus Termiticorpusculum sp.]MCL2256646.1 hypothetical protein [Candidatus Termiticorpusculum sp.]MCL2293175.1 hypothetical protein [Candidatus Termiticorpusculum sp.]MDR0461207.1 hypothetical protein [Nitrososphaerota archaeon]